MRIVMMGTGPFAVPTLKWLLRSEHDVAALVTRPVPLGRGRDKQPVNPTRDVAEGWQPELKILAPESINDEACIADLQDLESDLMIVCDFGQILGRGALAAARWGGINLHASLLPRYRGAAPIHWAIYHGERETGVTVIHMSPRLDAGPCLLQRSVPIGAHETAVQLETRLAELGVAAVQEVVQQFAELGDIPPGRPQDETLASRAPRLTKEDGQVRWGRSAQQIQRQIQAFLPWPGSSTHWHRDGRPPLRILLDQATHRLGPDAPPGPPPGSIVRVPDTSPESALLVQTGEGLLAIEQLHPAGKNVMTAAEFQRGYRLAVGDIWGDA